jgi:hypothetical protein
MPGPWAALAYDAARLLLDAIERDIRTGGGPTREGVRHQLDQAKGMDGQPVFVKGARAQAEMVTYCYEAGDVYPGRVTAP